MLRCPICKRPVEETDAAEVRKSFPFCSERCKLIDLGRWLTDAYQIPVEPTDEGDDEAPVDVWVDPNAKPNRG